VNNLTYQKFDPPKTNIIDYITWYYSQTRPHQYSNGFALNISDKSTGVNTRLWPKLLDHYNCPAIKISKKHLT